MIEKYLDNHYTANKLYNSYLISTNKLELGFVELQNFIKKLLCTDSLGNAADFICIEKIDKKVKGIAVEQIREMQKFLYKTSVITGKKVAVIYAADQMNLNAANSCLKVLEDTPANSYLFLLTDNPSSIIPTVRSRCVKLHYNYESPKEVPVYDEFIIPMLNNTQIIDRVKFIDTFLSKDRELWKKFALFIQDLISRFCKKSIGMDCCMSEKELALFAQLKSKSPLHMQGKYDQIKRIVDDTNEFDLDLRASCILILDQFNS